MDVITWSGACKLEIGGEVALVALTISGSPTLMNIRQIKTRVKSSEILKSLAVSTESA